MDFVLLCRNHIILVFNFVCNFALGFVNLGFVCLLSFYSSHLSLFSRGISYSVRRS